MCTRVTFIFQVLFFIGFSRHPVLCSRTVLFFLESLKPCHHPFPVKDEEMTVYLLTVSLSATLKCKHSGFDNPAECKCLHPRGVYTINVTQVGQCACNTFFFVFCFFF